MSVEENVRSPTHEHGHTSIVLCVYVISQSSDLIYPLVADAFIGDCCGISII